jgi:hypothetical protein
VAKGDRRVRERCAILSVGGIACTGATGEDYVIPGYNALILEATDPQEFVSLYGALHDDPETGHMTGERQTTH